MTTFAMVLQGSTQHEIIPDVREFIGEDESGSFGLLGKHERFMTVLTFGLARFSSGPDGQWRFLALPEALVYFSRNILQVTTRRYFLDDSYDRISDRLNLELRAEEEAIADIKSGLRRIEQELLQRVMDFTRR